MDKTYLDYFNYYLKQFLNEIISYFPYTKSMILENYRAILEGTDNKNDLYVKYFMTKANQHLLAIAKKDVALFDNEVLYLIEGVNFHDLWRSSESNDNNKSLSLFILSLLSFIIFNNSILVYTVSFFNFLSDNILFFSSGGLPSNT